MNTTIQPGLTDRRPATAEDVGAIHGLLKGYADKGNLLPRSIRDIEINLADFRVVEQGGRILACGALELFPNSLGEVRSLAVDETHGRAGLGTLLVAGLIDEARMRGLTRLMALTYVPAFFHKLEFRTVPKAMLPEKVWGICVKCYKFYDCDEIAVLLYL
jgi:amino-acid N-acetyltransferase